MIETMYFEEMPGSGYSLVKMNELEALCRQLVECQQQATERKYKWATIINSLAVMVLDGADSNDRDYAEEMIAMVIPYLGLDEE